MANCAKCGKHMFFSFIWKNKELFPDFYEKNLCVNCHAEMSKTARIQNQISLLEQPFSDADKKGKRMVT